MSDPRDSTPSGETLPASDEELVTRVRERYAEIAARPTASHGCGCSTTRDEPAAVAPSAAADRIGYHAEELAAVPEEANLGLGCGAPIELLAPAPGETVLDLGSGPGLDALLAAQRVGAEGRVIGVDMTPEMIARARASARRAGLPQAEFRHGRLEELPVDDLSVDAVTSNCVINLVPDKARVFREAARVLKPGGRLVVSDIVLDAPLPPAVAGDLLAWAGCIAGALPREEYFAAVFGAGLERIEVLADRDALELLGGEIPGDVLALLERTGTRPEELTGRVRSVTFRAFKPTEAEA